MKAVIIGSGISGLTSATLLAQAGAAVEVYERNQNIGGVTAFARKNGYCWEQGPLLLGELLPGERAYELLNTLGITLDTVQADRGIEMPDYSMWHPEEYAGPYWRRERLKELFPEEARGIDAYYRFSDDMLRLQYYARRCEEKGGMIDQIRLFFAWQRVRKYAALSAEELMGRFFTRPEIIALFTGILADMCVAPSEFQGLGVPYFNIETAFDKRIPLTENRKQIRGGYCYIRGGVEKLVDALAQKITEKGGALHTGATVEKILVENEKVTGIRLKEGKTVTADIVVASGGGREVFYDLVSREHLDKEYLDILEEFHPMDAVFMVHLGVDFDPLMYQKTALCYYYKTYDIEGSVKKLRVGIYHEGYEGFLIYVPSAVSPGMAPPGCHAVTIYTICPDTLGEGSWEDKKGEYADTLISLAEAHLPGLKGHIMEKLIMTPVEYRKMTHLKKCAFGGNAPIMGVRNPPHVTPVTGLYFVGAQSESMGGVAGVMMGAKKAFEEMKKREAL